MILLGMAHNMDCRISLCENLSDLQRQTRHKKSGRGRRRGKPSGRIMDARHKQKPWILLGIFVLSCSTGDALLPAASVRKHFAATSSASARKGRRRLGQHEHRREYVAVVPDAERQNGARVENMRASFDAKAVAASEPVLKSSHMAAAKTKTAAVAAAAAAAAAVPVWEITGNGPDSVLKMACFCLPLLGLWKANTVSYGHGNHGGC